jgi:hypothetical protein
MVSVLVSLTLAARPSTYGKPTVRCKPSRVDTNEVISLDSPVGPLRLRPERDEDRDFRFDLFCRSRLPEWDLVQLDPHVREQLMQHQFHAQTVSYRQQFPFARFDIIELGDEPIGRIVVDRPSAMVHIVDQAIVPHLRNRGIGTAIMRALMAEASRKRLRSGSRWRRATILRSASICASASSRS